MTFTEFATNAGSNILGELICGAFGKKLADYLLGKAADFLNKRRSYKKFIGRGEESRRELEAFFQALNDEINEKRAAVDKKTYKKAKTAEKRAEIMLSEFCLYTGISQSGIESELSAYEAYRNLEDDDLKQAIVDVLLAMRKYYSESKLSDDNQALLSLLCSEDVTEILAKKIVAQFAGRVSLVSGGTTAEDGAKVVVKSLELTKLECPYCHSGILQELRSSGDKMFSCSNCGAQFAVGDFSDEFKVKINNNLDQANDYLKILCDKIDNLLLAVESTNKKILAEEQIIKIAETYFERASEYSEERDKNFYKYLDTQSESIINELETRLPSLTVETIRLENLKTMYGNLTRELNRHYPNSDTIITITRKFGNDCLAAFCNEAVNVKFERANIINRLNNFPTRLKEKYGELLLNFLIQSTVLPGDEDVRSAICDFSEGVVYSNHDSSYYLSLMEKRVEQGFYRDKFDNDLFIACSSRDEEQVEEIARYLDEYTNIKYFYYKNHLIYDEKSYKSKLNYALMHTKCFLFIYSANSVKTDCEAIDELETIRDDRDFEYFKNGLHLGQVGSYCPEFTVNNWVPRICYVIDGKDPKDIAAQKIVKEFFGALPRIKNNPKELAEIYDIYIRQRKWWDIDYWHDLGFFAISYYGTKSNGESIDKTVDARNKQEQTHKTDEPNNQKDNEAKPVVNERQKQLKIAKMYLADGSYDKANEIYEKLKEENPEDMQAYIGLIRVASCNYTAYEGFDLENSINSAKIMFGNKLRGDSEYREYENRRNKYLKDKQKREQTEQKKQRRQEEVEQKREQAEQERQRRHYEAEQKREEKRLNKAVQNNIVKSKSEKIDKKSKLAQKKSTVIAKIKYNAEVIFCVSFGIISAVVFSMLIAFSVINGNAYFISITVGFSIFIVSGIICLVASFYKETAIWGNVVLGVSLFTVCLVLIWYNQVTILCVFFISIGFLVPLIIFFIIVCCHEFTDDESFWVCIGCFIGGIFWLICSLCALCCNIGFGEYKINGSEYARYNAYTNEVVIVPDGVTSIGANAFGFADYFSHSEVVEIILPDGLTTIGDNAFSLCENLKTINIPESVTYISPTAFEGTAVKELYLPAGVTESVVYLAIAESYTVSENNTSFYLDSGCLVRASDNCLMLVSSDGTLAEGITSVAHYAYSSIKTAISVTFPDGISTVEANTFNGCSASCITIGSDVTTIRTNAFYGCTAAEIVVEEGVTTIESGAFSGADPQKVTVPFIGCYKSTTSAYFGDIFGSEKTDVSTYKDVAGNRIPKGLTSVTVLGGEIYESAFNGCKKLTRITIGSGVTSIGQNALYSCSSLTALYIYEGLSSIGTRQFYTSISLDIFYSGSAESWANIEKEDKWDKYLTAVFHYDYTID